MEKTEEAAPSTRRRTLDLSVTQVAASALAAVVGAVLASELGVYGTIIGAAVVSTGATVGSALFQHLFRRTGEQLRDLATSGPARPVGPADPTGPSEQPAADFDPFDPGGERTRMMAALAPPVPVDSVAVYRGRTTWRPKGWKTYALMGVLVFGLAMGTVTVVELVAGKPMAAVVSNEPGHGTSFGGGSVQQDHGSGGPGGSDRKDPAGVPSSTPSGPAGGGVPSSGASSGSSGGPSPTPSSSPSGTPQPDGSASATPSAGPTPGGGAAGGGADAAGTGADPSATPAG